jgi:hypothetical protein
MWFTSRGPFEEFQVSHPCARVLTSEIKILADTEIFCDFGIGKKTTDPDTERCYLAIPKPKPKDKKFK